MARDRRIEWSALAESDLDEIVSYIALDSPINAERVLSRLQGRAQSLKQFAEAGRTVPELRGADASGYEYRELIERPWRIVCRIEKTVVYVTAVLDSRRDLTPLLHARFARADDAE